ncbi:potassium channel family protein [Streptacidiphilus griseoplanus]|uniref:potassium channel family protein n=1 Tax=Peterkaempfera griseoplana TaxID=66896 RepID=UPI0006E35623|nr:potassium channel family protein [Peterkaempfera griseoplana]
MPDSEPARTAGAPYGGPAPGPGRRLLLRTLLRSTATMAVLLTLYYVAPLDGGRIDRATVLELVAGLVLFCGLAVRQTLAVMRSDHPRLRALEALSAVVPLFLLVFSTAYYLLARNAGHSFTEPLDRTDALYFTVTVFATVGFGDIAPLTTTARVLTTVQMTADLILVGVIARALLGAVQVGLRRRADAAPGPDRDPG